MTTKPKAQKFRVRRTRSASARASEAVDQSVDDVIAGVVSSAQDEPSVMPPAQGAQTKPKANASAHSAQANTDAQLFDPGPNADGFGDTPFPGSAASDALKDPKPAKRKRKSRGAISEALEQDMNAVPPEGLAQTGDAATAAEGNIDEQIDAIRREGLTGRQLRVARRVAQQHKLAPTSDFDAVRLLRQQGINPFQRSTASLSLLNPDDGGETLPVPSENKLPETVKPAAPPPADILSRIERESDISQIQQDIAKRRRRKTTLLLARIAVFVGIPTALAGFYFYTIATPMYATNTSFLIQQAEAATATPSLFSGSPLGNSQDSIAVQDYLESRDAMLRLDADVGFKSHFEDPDIDAIQRLPENSSNEKAYKVYSDRVTIGYDPTEGLLRMEVVAADPLVSQKFSEALITYAEESVDQLTKRQRDDQMAGANQSLQDAEANMRAAQENIIELQEQLGIISPEAETSSLMGQISSSESQLLQKRLQLQQLLDNARPNQARVDGVQGDIRRLEDAITNLRGQMTEAQGSSGSLARINAELGMAEVELQTRQMMLQTAVQALETSRTEANRQTRYLSLSSTPVAPDEAAYPRKFENTMLAFLLFSGIFLMASLTAAVLREQVSA